MDIQNVKTRLRQILDATAPGLVEKAVLFGSRVRGDNGPDSDLDIIVVIKGDCPWLLKKSVLIACYAIDLEFDIVTDVKVLGSADMAGPRGKQPFILEAFKCGIDA